MLVLGGVTYIYIYKHKNDGGWKIGYFGVSILDFGEVHCCHIVRIGMLPLAVTITSRVVTFVVR